MLLGLGRDNNRARVKQLQEGLAHFGYHPGSADGIFGEKTEVALEAWQAKSKLYPDGLFGNDSATVWNEQCNAKNVPQFLFLRDQEIGPPLDDSLPRLKWATLAATPMPNNHGFKSLVMREDAAAAYKKLDTFVSCQGGYMTTAGGKRGLSAEASPSRSKKSFHYTGRAFDLATYSALGDPDTDPFLCVREEGSRNWTVWCRVVDKDAPTAHQVPVVTLDVTICHHKKTSSGKRYTQLEVVKWTGQAFSLTARARELGFEPIRGRTSFFSGGNYMGAEWWHFQWIEGLVKGKSTFGGELLRVYSLAECKKFVYWNDSKDAAFGVAWF